MPRFFLLWLSLRRVQMKTIIFLICFGMTICSVKAKDSSSLFLTCHLNKRKIGSFDQFYQRSGPFTENSIVSVCVLANKTICKLKHLAIQTHMGLNGRFASVAYLKSGNAILSATENIKSQGFYLAFQSGFSADRRIHRIKNTEVSFGLE